MAAGYISLKRYIYISVIFASPSLYAITYTTPISTGAVLGATQTFISQNNFINGLNAGSTITAMFPLQVTAPSNNGMGIAGSNGNAMLWAIQNRSDVSNQLWIRNNTGSLNSVVFSSNGVVEFPFYTFGCAQFDSSGNFSTTGSACGSGGGTGGSIDWELNGSHVVTGSTWNATTPLTLTSVGGVATAGVGPISLSTGVSGTLSLSTQTNGAFISSVNATSPIQVTPNGVNNSTVTISLSNSGVGAGTFPLATVTVSPLGIVTSISSGTSSSGGIVSLSTGVTNFLSVTTQTIGAFVSSANVNASLTVSTNGANNAVILLGVNPSSGTLQGNTFNGSSELLQLNSSGQVPSTILVSSFPQTGVGAGTYPLANVTVTPQGLITSISTGTSGGGSTSVEWQLNGSNVVAGSTFNALTPLTLTSVGGVATASVGPISLSTGVSGTLSMSTQTNGAFISSVNATSPIQVTPNGLNNSTITISMGNSGVSSGYFTLVNATVNAQGLITGISSGTVIQGIVSLSTGVTNFLSVTTQTIGAFISSVNATSPIQVTSNGLNNSTITISLANSGVSAGSFTNSNVTVNQQGLIISISSGSSGSGIVSLSTGVTNFLSVTTQTIGAFISSVNVSAALTVTTPNNINNEPILLGVNSSSVTLYGPTVPLGSGTSGNYVASLQTVSPLSGGSSGSAGANLTISISTNGFPAGATNYIFNQNKLQSGATAYPDFLYVNSSSTINNETATGTLYLPGTLSLLTTGVIKWNGGGHSGVIDMEGSYTSGYMEYLAQTNTGISSQALYVSGAGSSTGSNPESLNPFFASSFFTNTNNGYTAFFRGGTSGGGWSVGMDGGTGGDDVLALMSSGGAANVLDVYNPTNVWVATVSNNGTFYGNAFVGNGSQLTNVSITSGGSPILSGTNFAVPFQDQTGLFNEDEANFSYSTGTHAATLSSATILNLNSSTGTLGVWLPSSVPLLTLNSTSPSVQGGNVFFSSNTVPTTINNFTNGTTGQIIVVNFDSTNTTVANNSFIDLTASANYSPSKNTSIEFVMQNNIWHEVARGGGSSGGVIGLGSTNQVTYWMSASQLTGSNNFTFNGSTVTASTVSVTNLVGSNGFGTNGQVWTSQGTGLPNQWTTISSGGSGSTIYNATSTAGFPFGFSASTAVYSGTVQVNTIQRNSSSNEKLTLASNNISLYTNGNLNTKFQTGSFFGGTFDDNIVSGVTIGQTSPSGGDTEIPFQAQTTPATQSSFPHSAYGASVNGDGLGLNQVYFGGESIPGRDTHFFVAGGTNTSCGAGCNYQNISSSTLIVDTAYGSPSYGFVGINVSTPTAPLTVGGHIEVSSTTPSISACGSGGPAPTIQGNDVVGNFKAAVTATSCTITFAVPWTNAPSCSFIGTSATDSITGWSVTTTGFVLSGTLGADIISYICLGWK